MTLKKIQSDPSFKGAVGRSTARIYYLDRNLPKALRHVLLWKDVIITIPCVIYSRKDFFLLDEMNEKLGAMGAAGLIKFWYSEDFGKFIDDMRENMQARTLSLDDLMGCFSVLMFGLTVSFFAFTFELLASVYRYYISYIKA